MRIVWNTIISSLLITQIGLAQDSTLQSAKDAIAEVHRIISDGSKAGPGAMTGVLKKVDQVIDRVEQAPLYQNEQSVELLVELTTLKIQSLRHQRKIADARRLLKHVDSKLEGVTMRPSAFAVAESRIILLLQDLSFDDQDWKDLDRNVMRLKKGVDNMDNNIDAVRQKGAVVIQLLRYSNAVKKTNEGSTFARDVVERIQNSDTVSEMERWVIVGRIVAQVLDGLSQDDHSKKEDWLRLAEQAWLKLRYEKETSTKILAGQLIAHQAALAANMTKGQTGWREYEDWLRRDSFENLRDPYLVREYIEANVRYLNGLPLHLRRTYQFLDEFESALETMSASPGSLGLMSAELARLMRSQIDKRISNRKTALNRPSLQQAAPPIDFLFINDGERGSLSQYLGKVVVLEFWNPRCGPCLSSFPWLSEFHRKHRERGLLVLGCTFAADEYLIENGQELRREQSVEKFRKFLIKYEVKYPMVLSLDSNVLNVYGVLAEPTFVVIDRKGKILAYAVGVDEFKTDAFQKTIMKALEQ